MVYKLLALDLDDTLLDEQSQISERNLRAIAEAKRRGLLVTIATGRMFNSARRYAEQLQIDLPVIAYHGALIKNPQSGEELWHCPVPRDLAAAVIMQVEAAGFHINVYFEDSLYTQEENEYTRYYEDFASVAITPVGDLVSFMERFPQGPTKLTIIDWDGRIERLEKSLNAELGEQLKILQSRPYFLEITCTKATKGQALQFLAQKQGIRREETVAIGDSYNDLDMIQYAGLGVAVANARREVRDAADLVTVTNGEDGVAEVIEKYILNSESVF